ncbi:MAG: hypothetical protein Q7R69_01265 [bacterium]|nr:hypothetical protein [bacterium]
MPEANQILDFNTFRQRRLAKIQKETADITQKMEKRNRVKTSDIILMVGTALFFDSIQALFLLIPFLGWALSSLISIYAWLTFYVWTSVKGWGVVSDTVKKAIVPKGKIVKFIIKWLTPLIELIPVVNVIPTWTVSIILQLLLIKAEDVLYNTTEGKVDLEKLGELYKQYRKVA